MREAIPEPVDRYGDDVRAISAALALCAFLWTLKALLVGWYVIVKNVNPLEDVSLWGMLGLGGANLVVCAGIAVGYRLIYALSRRMPPAPGKLLRSPGLFLIHAAVVVFAVLSFEVSRIYGWPLDITHIRSADDPRIITASILAYAGLLPIGLVLFGFVAKPALGAAIAALLVRMRWLNRPVRLWATLAIVTIALFATWFKQLKGINTYGIKDDPIVYFVMHYEPPFKPVNAKQTMAALAADLGDARQTMADPVSLAQPHRTLQRDFQLTAQAAAARGMNVLMIQMESTSSAHLDETTTPTMMRIARSGVSFRNHATVFSETSRASYALYFSDYMTDLGTTPRLLYQRSMPVPSLAGVLKNGGYDTAVVHSGFLSYADLRYMYENTGFDRVIDATNMWSGEEELPWSWGVREELAVDEIVKWIDQPRTKPFFMLYATEFPHHPYVCPIAEKPYPPTSWVNRYRNSLYYADKCVGMLLDRMQKMKVLDNTLIVVVGDHGETVSSYPVGHGVAISREELFTPFIISNPKLFGTSQQSKMVTNHLDVAPTIAKLVGLNLPAEWLGRDMLADEVPARLLFVQAKLAKVHAVLDNGLVYVLESCRERSLLYDISNAGFDLLADNDPRMALRPGYQQQNELFQKWAIWRHMARATGDVEVTTISKPPAEAAVPAAASVGPSSSLAH